MSAHDLVFCNPPLDHNRPGSGPIFTNDSGLHLCVAVSLEINLGPNEPLARIVLHGVNNLHRQHTIDVTAPQTSRRIVVAVVVLRGEGEKSRDLTLEVATAGTTCVARVLSVTPCPV